MRYLEQSGLLMVTWSSLHRGLVALSATGTDYVERPLDTVRLLERSVTQTNTINVAGDFNAIDSVIVQMNANAISRDESETILNRFDAVVRQLPPDVAASEDVQASRKDLDKNLRAGDRLGAAGIMSGLARVVSIAKDSAVLVQALPAIYRAIQLLFHLP